MNEVNIVNLNVRTLDQEPDSIAIVPSAPSFVIIGTYSLVGNSNSEASGGRKGSLEIIPFSPTELRADHATLVRKDFSFGIYDIHFHPRYTDLLGVATSNAEILFFRVQIGNEKAGSPLPIDLNKVGSVAVEKPHEDDGRLAIITQFKFIDTGAESVPTVQVCDGSISSEVLLTATTQFGNTKLMQACIPASSATDPAAKSLETQTLNVHKQSFDLEAWAVLPLLMPSSDSLLVLSGGDDSQLLISELVLPSRSTSQPNLDTVPLTKLLSDKHTHTAGVISICSLGSFPQQALANLSQPASSSSTIILTGSYDEIIRVFLLTPPSATNQKYTIRLLRDLKLFGGVWRITLLDQYPCPSGQGTDNGYHYILLIAGHTAGVFILRLSSFRLEYDTDSGNVPEENRWHFAFKVEKTFVEHKSLVYAVAAKRDKVDEAKWHILSTSFYDKKMCNWEWVDDQR